MRIIPYQLARVEQSDSTNQSMTSRASKHHHQLIPILLNSIHTHLRPQIPQIVINRPHPHRLWHRRIQRCHRTQRHAIHTPRPSRRLETILAPHAWRQPFDGRGAHERFHTPHPSGHPVRGIPQQILRDLVRIRSDNQPFNLVVPVGPECLTIFGPEKISS